MKMRRRTFMAGLAAAISGAPAVLRAQPAAFRFGLTPVFLDNDWQLLEHLHSHLRAEDYFARSFFTYGHRNVVRAVAQGLAHSGSVDGYARDVMRRHEPELVDQTRIAWESEDFGFPLIVVTRDPLETARSQRFLAALQAMPQTEAGQQALTMPQFDGFVLPEAHSFDRIAARMRIVAERG